MKDNEVKAHNLNQGRANLSQAKKSAQSMIDRGDVLKRLKETLASKDSKLKAIDSDLKIF